MLLHTGTPCTLTLTGHFTQAVASVWPTLRLKVPAGQGVPAVILELGQYRPAGQGCKQKETTREGSV